jgi:translation initiation factor IF-3
MAKENYRVGAAITAPKVRVRAPGNQDLGVFDIAEALRMASERGVDLVEVRPSMNPPVCDLVKYEEFERMMRVLESSTGNQTRKARLLSRPDARALVPRPGGGMRAYPIPPRSPPRRGGR